MVANDAHLHLLLNHLPIIGSLLAALLLACGMAMRSKDLTRVALGLTVLLALITIPVAASGHDAEDVIEGMQGISEDRIDAHQERAEKAVIAMYVTGGFAALGLLVGLGGGGVPRWASALCLLLLLAASGLMAWTGKAGGEISHPETRPGFVAPEAPGGGHEHGHDHDD